MTPTDAWPQPAPEYLLGVAQRREQRAAALRQQAQQALDQAAEHEQRAAELRQQAQAATA